MKLKKFLCLSALFLCIMGCDETGTIEIENQHDEKDPDTQQCSNDCDKGKKQCVQNTLQTCDDYNNDGCFEWGNDTVCTDKCENNECKSNAQTCTNECTKDEKQCVHNTLQTCGDYNSDGCFEWGNDTVCTDKCENNECKSNAQTCTNACTKDEKQCVQNTLQTCGDYNDDGCFEWGNDTVCPDKCENNECKSNAQTCTNACTKDEKQCVQNTLQTCGDYNSDGCFEWGYDKECLNKCENKACIDPSPACLKDVKPIEITDFSTVIKGSTKGKSNCISNYPDCFVFEGLKVLQKEKSDTSFKYYDLSGPEDYYVVNIKEPGVLAVGIKVSSHYVTAQLLKTLDANSCMMGNNESIGTHVEKGKYYIVADTMASKPGGYDYELRVTFIPDSSKCGMSQDVVKRIEEKYGCGPVSLPNTGRVPKESHCVTDHDQAIHGGDWWPTSKTMDVDKHIAYTSELYGQGIGTGTEWCSANSKGQFGHSATGVVPAEAEAWSINMLWSPKPDKGTRFLVLDPITGKTVVAAGGYETGPGACERIAGVVPETDKYLKEGSSRNAYYTIGIMKDQKLKYGPIDCSK